MTVKEVADKMGKTSGAIYAQIKKGQGVGVFFEYKPGQGYVCDGRKLQGNALVR